MYIPGLEVFYQVSLYILLLLLTETETATTSGLQTFFQKKSFYGIDSTVMLREAFRKIDIGSLSKSTMSAVVRYFFESIFIGNF